MAVGLLQITRYDSSTGPWHVDTIVHPAWNAVVAAIRQLDRCFFPFVWLFDDPEAPANSVPQFEVVGGTGAYAVVIRTRGAEQWLQNPLGGSEDVAIWVSDQGASVPASKVCISIFEVLEAAEHYFLYGQPAPQSVWV